MGPRLRECCWQGHAEVVSNSRNKIHQTWGPLFPSALYLTQVFVLKQIHFGKRMLSALCRNNKAVCWGPLETRHLFVLWMASSIIRNFRCIPKLHATAPVIFKQLLSAGNNWIESDRGLLHEVLCQLWILWNCYFGRPKKRCLLETLVSWVVCP